MAQLNEPLTDSEALRRITDASEPHAIVITIATKDAEATALDAGDNVTTSNIPFANAVRFPGGSGTITGFNFIDRDDQGAPLELWLFSKQVTLAAADAAFALSDGDLALCVGVIPTGPYFDAGNGQIAVNSTVRMRFTLPYGTTLYGALKAPTTPTYSATGPLLQLFIDRD